MVLETLSDSTGAFNFATNAYTCAYANEPVYITAAGGIPSGTSSNSNIMLAAALGTLSQ